MINLADLVSLTLYMIIGASICALLWYAIGYCEKSFGGPPLVWSVVRVVFVLLIVIVLVNILLVLPGGISIIRK